MRTPRYQNMYAKIKPATALNTSVVKAIAGAADQFVVAMSRPPTSNSVSAPPVIVRADSVTSFTSCVYGLSITVYAAQQIEPPRMSASPRNDAPDRGDIAAPD